MGLGVDQVYSLVVLSESHAFSHPLASDVDSFCIGRQNECDIPVKDPSLSRQHAVLAKDGDAFFLEDLGSRNGSVIAGEPLTPRTPTEWPVGAIATLGRVSMVLQKRSQFRSPLALWDYVAFERLVSAECARARHQESSFGVVLIRSAAMGEVVSLMAGALNPWSPAARYGEEQMQVMVVGLEDIDQWCSQLRSTLTEAECEVDLYHVSYPGHGQTFEQLQSALTLQMTGGSSQPTSLITNIITPSDRAERSGVVADEAMQAVYRLARRVAQGEINVLITGETGVGKEILAKWIHTKSPRSSGPMVSLNCAAVSEAMLESELFGHIKGAFSSADADKPGLFELADKGTMFLDELGDMPSSLQSKLLRVLEDGMVRRVGDVEWRQVDVRIIAATHRDLERAIAADAFRADLFYRLSGFTLAIPPLRERRGDITPLAEHFIELVCERMSRTKRPALSASVVHLFNDYSWPGNVRELRNVVERAVLLCTGDHIELKHLPLEKFAEPLQPAGGTQQTAEETLEQAAASEIVAQMLLHAEGFDDLSLQQQIEVLEKLSITRAIRLCGGNKSKALTQLGMARKTFFARCKKYGLLLADREE